MKEPLHHRGGIPFYIQKTEKDFRTDPYEQYDSMVVRNLLFQYRDKSIEHSPYQRLFGEVKLGLDQGTNTRILELGCGVGRLIGSIAMAYPLTNCWGVDYSYQMLKAAKDIWVDGKGCQIDLSNKGYIDTIEIDGYSLKNLQLGLTAANELPFVDDSFDVLLHSFLIDRLSDPKAALLEMKRVLVNSGKMIILTPFNFTAKELWAQYYPADMLREGLIEIGFAVIKYDDNILIKEALDYHGNHINWQCSLIVLQRND